MAEDQKPKAKKPSASILLAVSAASIIGSLAFAATFGGFYRSMDAVKTASNEVGADTISRDEQAVEFLAIEPLLVSLGAAANGRQLRFEGYLEVEPGRKEDVAQLMPRIMDVLNTYLRAVNYSDVEEPVALLKLRLQMLRRVQLVVGEGYVNDLLVSQFVIG